MVPVNPCQVKPVLNIDNFNKCVGLTIKSTLITNPTGSTTIGSRSCSDCYSCSFTSGKFCLLSLQYYFKSHGYSHCFCLPVQRSDNNWISIVQRAQELLRHFGWVYIHASLVSYSKDTSPSYHSFGTQVLQPFWTLAALVNILARLLQVKFKCSECIHFSNTVWLSWSQNLNLQHRNHFNWQRQLWQSACMWKCIRWVLYI